ncbi:uncharacterized protein LOC131069921 [Cryptomeria japonica]|uniref:uncharacterized protein LOC131069921 n=1 Tax=Cryptomeria japonica TaxID=3369 RepID=UPI0025AC936F|nr:uncharacterized protein LOC131069921 [Cryptomeria japonica]
MKEAEYLVKQVSLGITVGLGATPQAKIHPVRPTIEGVAATAKLPSQEAQSSSATTIATTTTTTIATTSATTTLATTSTAFVAPVVSTMPPPLVTTMVTSSSIVSQMPVPTMTPTIEIVIIHNVESDSNQEEANPKPKKVESKKRKIMTPSSTEK